jgi:flagellar biosynthesis chaperone FliJ
MTQAVLKSLERVREQREDSTRRALEAATRAVHSALQALQERRREQQAIEQDIALTLRRPLEQGGSAGAQMLQMQRSIGRVELLREHLVQAREKVQQAQAELDDKQRLRVQALNEHLRARHKREAVQDQLQRERLADERLAERRQSDAVLDMAASRATH